MSKTYSTTSSKTSCSTHEGQTVPVSQKTMDMLLRQVQ